MGKLTMPLNRKQSIRCRTALKNYLGQKLLFVGVLDKVSLNKNIFERFNQERNALFVEVHAIKDLAEPNSLDLDIGHVHCQVQNQKLSTWIGNFVTFSAEVTEYHSRYRRKDEIRYGLKNFRLETKANNAINELNQTYHRQLTIYQRELIQNMKLNFQRYYENRTLLNDDEINHNILNSSINLVDKTNLLLSMYDNLREKPHKLSEDKIKLISNESRNELVKRLNKEIALLKNENEARNEQNEQNQNNLIHQINQLKDKNKKYQQLIDFKANDLSLFDLLKQYFQIKFYSNNKNKGEKKDESKQSNSFQSQQVDEQQLNRLKRHFNK